MAGITAELKRVAAVEAIDWVKAVGKVVFADKEESRAEELASAEYDMARYVGIIVVADKARSLLRAVNRAIRAGDIPKSWDNTDQTGELITTGLSQYDPRIAFQASLRTAYAAGREQRIEDDDSLTYKVYRTMRDSRVRDSHALLDGVCLPTGDEFWDEHSPPLGWRCRCKAYGLDEDGLAKLVARGVKLQREAPKERMVTYKNKATGEEETLPASVEPGWNFKPGSADAAKALAEMVTNRMRLIMTEDA